MRVAVAHNVPAAGEPDSEDVLRQAVFVEDVLSGMGHRTTRVALEPGINGVADFIRQLRQSGADIIFNLIESPGGISRLHPAAAALMDIAGLRYTGSSYEALLNTTDKAVTKALLKSNGIPTPPWGTYPHSGAGQLWKEVAGGEACIAKPLLEDASIGITDESVFFSDAGLEKGLDMMYEMHGPLLVERYIDGREFNVSVIESSEGSPMTMPVAEMRFDRWPEGKPRIVNYSAKWDEKSFEYNNTKRTFIKGTPLERELSETARNTWEAFGLSGYARVDMRAGDDGRVYVLEVNANPCISPDAGFMAAITEGGLSSADMMEMILNASLSSIS